MEIMQAREKFYSDIIRAAKNSSEAAAEKFLASVQAYDSSLKDIAQDLLACWELEYKEANTAEKNAEYFFNLYCFLVCDFDKEQDFSDQDWQYLVGSVTASQDELDIDLLNSYLSIFLERGVL